ncbi:MAG: hypothetical protein RAK25_05970, partial [TACK group archaeon]|nr:hypothetical protein [TACK group archaeon]
DIRMKMIKTAQEAAASANFYDFVQDMLTGKLAQLMQKDAKKVFPIAFLDVAKSKVKAMGEKPVEAAPAASEQAQS